LNKEKSNTCENLNQAENNLNVDRKVKKINCKSNKIITPINKRDLNVNQ